MIWVEIGAKREKIAEKWHFQIENATFCYFSLSFQANNTHSFATLLLLPQWASSSPTLPLYLKSVQNLMTNLG